MHLRRCVGGGPATRVRSPRPQAGTREPNYARASSAGTRPSPGRSLKLAYVGPPSTPQRGAAVGDDPVRASRERAERSSASPRAWVPVRRVARGQAHRPRVRHTGGMQRVALPQLRYRTREVRVSSQAASKRATKETGECQRSWRERSSAPPELASLPKRIPSPPLTAISVEADSDQLATHSGRRVQLQPTVVLVASTPTRW